MSVLLNGLVTVITALFPKKHPTNPKKPAHLIADWAPARAGLSCLLDACGGKDSHTTLQQSFCIRDETCPYGAPAKLSAPEPLTGEGWDGGEEDTIS